MNNVQPLDRSQVTIRDYMKDDFKDIEQLYQQVGWTTFVNNRETAQKAWENSEIRFVITYDEEIIGLIRGLTDYHISIYIAEIVIDQQYRGLGFGTKLINHCHNLYPNLRIDLLATQHSKEYYQKTGFTLWNGFRKSKIAK